jgi:phage terminase small subunit
MSESKHDQVERIKGEFNLTHKQALFAIQFNGNASASARLAGYKNPDQSGYRLIRNDQVKQAIRSIRDRDPVSILTPEQILTAWSKIAMSDIADPKACYVH